MTYLRLLVCFAYVKSRRLKTFNSRWNIAGFHLRLKALGHPSYKATFSLQKGWPYKRFDERLCEESYYSTHKYIYELKIVDKIEVLNLQPLSWVKYDIQILIHEFCQWEDSRLHIIAHTVVFGMMYCCDFKFNFVPMKVPCSLAGSVGSRPLIAGGI
jgi:hypothetical protein